MRILTGLAGVLKIEGDSIAIQTIPSYPSDKPHVWTMQLRMTDILKVRYVDLSPELGRILFAVRTFTADSEIEADQKPTVLSFDFRQNQAPLFKALKAAIDQVLQSRSQPNLIEVSFPPSRASRDAA